jgi:hypothetical protein
MASRMTEVGFRYAVCSLRAKPAELAANMEQLKLQLAHRRLAAAGAGLDLAYERFALIRSRSTAS